MAEATQRMETFTGRGANPVDAARKAHQEFEAWAKTQVIREPLIGVSTTATDSEEGAFFLLTLLWESRPPE